MLLSYRAVQESKTISFYRIDWIGINESKYTVYIESNIVFSASHSPPKWDMPYSCISIYYIPLVFNQRSMLVVTMSIVVPISVYTSVYPATDNKVWLIVNVSQPWWLEPFKCQPNVQSLWCASAGQYKFNFALCRRTVAQWYYKYLIIVLIPLFVLSQPALCVCPLPPA